MSVIFGDSKYTGQAEVLAERHGALFTLSEWAEWNNGEEAFATSEQVANLIDGLERIFAGKLNEEVEFGDEKYSGSLSALSNGDTSTVALIEIAEWGDFSNGAEATLDIIQAQNLLDLLRGL